MADRILLKLDGKYLDQHDRWVEKDDAYDYARASAAAGALGLDIAKYPSARIVRVRRVTLDKIGAAYNDGWRGAIDAAASMADERACLAQDWSRIVLATLASNIRGLAK